MKSSEPTRPLQRHGEVVYSNFDHVLNVEVYAVLRANAGLYAPHTAWNFCGSVWFDGTLWHEEVWIYRVPREIRSDENLAHLIEDVNATYGND